jgi:DNA-binding CsgD family transcriptional regulator
MIAVQRGRCQPGFEEEQVSRLAIMASDLEHLLMVRGRFSASSRQLKCLTAMLDLMPDPTMMVNRDGQVIHANAAAEDMLGREKALEVRHGKLATPSSREQHHLHRLIYEACGDGPTGGSLALPRDGWPPLILSVTPLLGQPARAALIVMRDPASEHRQLLAQLKSLFDLTAAEAEVAYSLAKGSTLAELAAIRDVSLGTLRNQLKSVFAKVGCSRQAELVLLVRSIPVTRQLTPGPTPQLALS